MNKSVIPQKLHKEMESDPEYKICALKDQLPHLIGPCDGRITREHAVYFAGKKVQEKWGIPPICAKHHGVDQYFDGGTASKEIRLWVALNRATNQELAKISKAFNYLRERERFNMKYGVWKSPVIVVYNVGISPAHFVKDSGVNYSSKLP